MVQLLPLWPVPFGMGRRRLLGSCVWDALGLGSFTILLKNLQYIKLLGEQHLMTWDAISSSVG